MAIARDNATGANNSGPQAGITFAHTCSGSLLYLIVVVAWRNTTVGSISSIAYNGVAMSFVTGNTRGTSRVEIWGLAAPATGANNVVVTHSAGFDNGCRAVAISHTGVDQSTPVGTPVTATSAAGNATVNVSSAAGEIVIDGVVAPGNSGSFTVGGSQTQEMNGQAGGATARGMSSTEPGAGTVTMSWTFSISPGWSTCAVAIKPDTGGGGIGAKGAMYHHLQQLGAY